jgi:PHD/YefM family antitoxin component YafN of YafNO toxin-antitoxin module
MILEPQLITRNGKKEFVILPYEQFEEISKIIEDYEDLIDLRKAKKQASGKKGKEAGLLLDELARI